MDHTPTSSPAASQHLPATTSLEIALDLLLSNSQPITIRNALAAYIQAADFASSPESLAALGMDGELTVEDAIIAFEHALDKHPLPLDAAVAAPPAAAPSRSPSPPRKKKTVRVKKKTKASHPSSADAPADSSGEAYSIFFRRPFVAEVDQLRREYYAGKAEAALKANPYPCSCGKCGDAVFDYGGYMYDADIPGVRYGYDDAYGYGFSVDVDITVGTEDEIRARARAGLSGTYDAESAEPADGSYWFDYGLSRTRSASASGRFPCMCADLAAMSQIHLGRRALVRRARRDAP